MSGRTDKFNGVLPVIKPVGVTSHDVVDLVRKITSQRSIGHAGTLDPLAEGLLVMLLGRATKVARFLSAENKVYLASVQLGVTSKTYDAEGVPPDAEPASVPDMSGEDWETLLGNFRGRISQQVPPFSAVQVDGERLYKRSRRGEEITEVPTREVEIFELELLSHDKDSLKLRVRCSKGTYIRSLANDIGERLGCGGYLSSLARIAAGRIAIEQAHTLEQVEELAAHNDLADAVLPIEKVLDFGALLVSDDFCPRVLHGARPLARDLLGSEGKFNQGDTILVKDRQGAVLAIAIATVASTSLTDATNVELLSYERVLR